MNILATLLTLASVAFTVVYGQQGEKGNSIIPFPRVGRGSSQGLIPFPRIGRDGGSPFMKRQLIPFPRVGKRTLWHLPLEVATEYEDFPSEDGDEGQGDGPDKRANNNGGMWFGPRLGRKKREASDNAAEEAPTMGDMKPLFKMLHNSNWAVIVPIKERGLEQPSYTFTPRLGRSGGSTTVVRPSSPPFTPRLGRSGSGQGEVGPPLTSAEIEEMTEDEEIEERRETRDNPFDPRLGRSNSGNPFDPRLGRGGNPFDPRLGRSSGNPFDPRLGRSSGNPFDPRLGRSLSATPYTPRLGRAKPSRGRPYTPRLG